MFFSLDLNEQSFLQLLKKLSTIKRNKKNSGKTVKRRTQVIGYGPVNSMSNRMLTAIHSGGNIAACINR